MDFNVNQRSVIDIINGDMLVAASAGSGKTTVLVERIINLILNHGVSINELLVITFTNMAALEMRERIIKLLDNRVNDENREFLDYQKMLLYNSNIQTFHSFCLDVIKNNYYRINMSGSFKIVKNAQRKIIINDVIEETFKYYYEKNDEEFLNLVNIYGGKYYDNNLREHILSIYAFLQNIVDVDKFIQDSINLYKIDEDVFDTKYGEILKIDILRNLNSFKSRFNEYDGIDKEDKLYKVLINDVGILDKLLECIQISYKDSYNKIQNVEFMRLPRLGEDYEDYKILRNDFKKYIDSLKKNVFMDDVFKIKERSCDLISVVNKMFEVVLEFSHRFLETKLRKNLIDFNDMEHLTIELLKNEDVCNHYRNKFKYIFIDEYQDTNYIQEYIVNSIKNNNNVFMVGDVKQSIYGFRGAKVDLFYDKYKTYNKIGEEKNIHPYENKILLYENYRSREEIINFINYVFENIMVPEISNIEYTKEEYLNCGASYETIRDENTNVCGEVSLSIIIGDDEREEDDENNDNDIDDYECSVILNYIKDITTNNYKIYDSKIDDYRDVYYKDIVILMRNVNSSIKSIMINQKLKEENIPVYFDGGEKFFDCIEVMVIISLLKIINNPLDDSDILTVLFSEIYNFTYDDLSYIRIIDQNDYIYNNIKKVLNLNNDIMDDIYLNEDFYINKNRFMDLFNKCKLFLDKLEDYRNKSIYMKIDDFIWFLYQDTKYYIMSSYMDDGNRRQGNLRVIFNKAKEFRLSRYGGLFNFIEYINNSKKYEEDLFIPKDISENENVIRIMSIHKSKGLEFPVVILCNTSSGFNFRDLINPISLNDKLGIGISHLDYDINLESDTLQRYVIRELNKRDIISEELRILYVALTRAKEKLFIVGKYNSYKNLERISDIKKCKSYLDFICYALLKYNDGILFNDLSLRDHVYNNYGFKINIYNLNEFDNHKEDINTNEEINIKDILDNNDNDFKYIEDILKFKYKYEESINLPLNLSVSQLLSYDNDKKLNINFKVPNFIDGNNKKIYTSLDIGNLYHLFMQNLELRDVIDYDYLDDELKRMVSKLIIKEEEIEYIKLHKILNFFESDIGNRVIKSFNLNKDNVHREFEFLMMHKIEDINKDFPIRIQGIVDLIFIEDDHIILIDYKTGISVFNDMAMIEKYKKQLYYYKVAIEKIFKKNVSEKYLFSFEKGEFIIVE